LYERYGISERSDERPVREEFGRWPPAPRALWRPAKTSKGGNREMDIAAVPREVGSSSLEG